MFGLLTFFVAAAAAAAAAAVAVAVAATAGFPASTCDADTSAGAPNKPGYYASYTRT
jgi:hypothetical protein